MTDVWQAGKTYVPGSLVRPSAVPAPQLDQIQNGDFETGDLTGWTLKTLPGNWSINTHPYTGTYSLLCKGGGNAVIVSDTVGTVIPGTSVTAYAMAAFHNNGTDDMGCQITLYWYDANNQFLSSIDGDTLTGKGGPYKSISVKGYAPAGAKYVRAVIGASTGTHGGDINFDQVLWSYSYQKPPDGLIYKATQASPGKSGTSEPTWPAVASVSVTDNEVTWEGVIATRIVWEASPIMKSGDTEPAWPSDGGGMVRDGTIDWQAFTSQITDVNCPHSKIVQIAAGKVYAGDKDIIRYSATVNPLDWTSTNDAGYLPFGLQTYGSNPVAALGLYRSNLVAFNAEGFQMWQVDEDPANTQLLDALPIGSTRNKALAPVANDLLFLSSQGVRSVGIAAASTNLKAGDVGMPIDSLVKEAMVLLANGVEPRSTFVPSLGQYWVAFNDADSASCTVYVYTINQFGQVGKWSRYTFPFVIEAFAQLDDDLYIRSGDELLRVSDDAWMDQQAGGGEIPITGFPIPGTVQWPWLDFGQPGVSKQLVGFDIVGSGAPSMSIGYDQTNDAAFTPPFAIPGDTVPGMVIPLPVMAPSLSLRITYTRDDNNKTWQLQAANLYLQDQRLTA